MSTRVIIEVRENGNVTRVEREIKASPYASVITPVENQQLANQMFLVAKEAFSGARGFGIDEDGMVVL